MTGARSEAEVNSLHGIKLILLYLALLATVVAAATYLQPGGPF